MRKQLQRRQDTGFRRSHPGCMWSLMRILDYHHWHSVKKLILPCRNNAEGRRIRSIRSRKATLRTHDNGEREESTPQAAPLQVAQHGKEASIANRKNRKNQVKASKHVSKKEESRNKWILSFTGQSCLWRTSEMHDTKPPAEDFPTTSPEDVMESSPSQKPMTPQDQFYDHVDLLEILKVNNEFFIKCLQDQATNTKVRLTKSSSYPAADPWRAISVTPSTLEHKQNEAWSLPKGVKLLVNSTRGPKLMTSQSQEDSQRFSNQGWNQLVTKRFKDIKQKLMYALQESKKENNPTSMEAFVSEDPSRCDDRLLYETVCMINGEKRSKVDGSDETDVGRRRLQRTRRTSSLNESLDKYNQLFETSCRREDQVKLGHSRSLKLRSEEKVTSTRNNPQKSTRRHLSLSDLDDSLCSFLNGQSRDAFRLAIPAKNVEDHKTSVENDAHIGPKSLSFSVDSVKSGRLEVILDTEDLLHEHEVEIEQGERFSMSNEEEVAQLSETSTLAPCSPALSISEELCSSAKCKESEIDETNMECHSPYFEEKMYDDDVLNYVRDVLEMSGFTEDDEHIGTWYSIDHPLDPLLYKELEAVRFQHELTFTDDTDHQLLFDLVNETIVDIHEKSYTYFPRALSFNGCKLIGRKMPKGDGLVEDVWGRIGACLSFRAEMVQCLDDIVGRDLAKGDGWMKHGWENECVVLEIEDLIFEELLDEL